MWNPSSFVVATDGREQSDGAIRAGAWLAESGAEWRVVSVDPPLPVVSAELDLQMTADTIQAQLGNRRRVVHEQLQRVLRRDVTADIHLRHGDPADVVCRVAEETNASLIVTGLGRRSLADRLLADETTLRIIRNATMPVLAVPPEFTGAPHTAIVGVDFSGPSVRAAEIVMRMMQDIATIYLMTVAPRADLVSLTTGGRAAYEAHAMPKLKQLVDELQSPERVHLQPVIKQGDPATELLKYAGATQSEVIAIGTRGLGLVARFLLGSVATKVVRASTVAVLTVPA
jgi:nucleotide-binding universal stress UspA family protein